MSEEEKEYQALKLETKALQERVKVYEANYIAKHATASVGDKVYVEVKGKTITGMVVHVYLDKFHTIIYSVSELNEAGEICNLKKDFEKVQCR